MAGGGIEYRAFRSKWLAEDDDDGVDDVLTTITAPAPAVILPLGVNSCAGVGDLLRRIFTGGLPRILPYCCRNTIGCDDGYIKPEAD